MKIKIAVVGKLKKSYITEGVCDFSRRLSKYTTVEIIEVKDERHGEGLSISEELLVKKKEGAKLRAALGEKSFVVCMDVNGGQLSTEQLAEFMMRRKLDRVKELAFVIGGPLGICDELLKSADCLLSLSRMTFPHELARLVLLEQLYRAEKILSGEPYHK